MDFRRRGLGARRSLGARGSIAERRSLERGKNSVSRTSSDAVWCVWCACVRVCARACICTYVGVCDLLVGDGDGEKLVE